ncbi:SMC-Scp complex subunit ScpB [Deefgea piscis]|uniref:SMC-Scp complex subunit ScpB n=1 Tax=Deefgea piscis TaxID=2739061 RepID=A0A6M8SQW3_9NEIS|nr:SMC-Scp complex subunit ScpB [Deefgea piscis]QKJ67595.1 SMC-Scp complex subunit ScpB [Deefgea piscis]
MDQNQAIKIIETVLLTSQEALRVSQIKKIFNDELSSAFVLQCLHEIAASWQDRGIELLELANGWRFRAKPEMQIYLNQLNPEKPPRYSRAVMETLAIIAYKQPITRGEIEEIRGVVVSSQIIQTLKERGWLEVIGHKEVPGRPELLATNATFLADLGLKKLSELPSFALDAETLIQRD